MIWMRLLLLIRIAMENFGWFIIKGFDGIDDLESDVIYDRISGKIYLFLGQR